MPTVVVTGSGRGLGGRLRFVSRVRAGTWLSTLRGVGRRRRRRLGL